MPFKLLQAGNFTHVPGTEVVLRHVDEVGVHQHDGVIYAVDLEDDSPTLEWAVAAHCDHNGGTLKCVDSERAVCPLHDWKLDLNTLEYDNGVKKQELETYTREDGAICVRLEDGHLEYLPHRVVPHPVEVELELLTHACMAVTIKIGQRKPITLVTDPWVKGPAFFTGWWHSLPASKRGRDIIEQADLFYISHPHPDHYHKESLRELRRRCVLMPNFYPEGEPDLFGGRARNLGYDVLSMPCWGWHTTPAVYELAPDVYVSILKSGDYRHDSGLYINVGGKWEGLFCVDSAALNNFVLPKNVDFMCCSFAGGANGHPLCWPALGAEGRAAIQSEKLSAMRGHVARHVRACEPRYYMPYAGWFEELAHDDIRVRNVKNKVEDIRKELRHQGLLTATTVLEPVDCRYTFKYDEDDGKEDEEFGKHFETQVRVPVPREQVRHYVDKQREAGEAFNPAAFQTYMEGSGFKYDLNVYLTVRPEPPLGLEWDKIQPSHAFEIIFRAGNDEPVECTELDYPYAAYEAYQDHAQALRAYNGENLVPALHIDAAQGALTQCYQQGLPWEDMAIGFQLRCERWPDIFHAAFWHYFTEEYVGHRVMQHES